MKSFLGKYKYPALILLLGLALMIFPQKKDTGKSAAVPSASAEAKETEPALTDHAYCLMMEQKLEQVLSQIQGAGAVRVMLTLEAGPQTNYLSDSSLQRSSEGERNTEIIESKTVILSSGSSYNEAAIVKTECPRFRGALIVSQGGDDASVCLKLTEAVSALLGLGADKITVVKMK